MSDTERIKPAMRINTVRVPFGMNAACDLRVVSDRHEMGMMLTDTNGAPILRLALNAQDMSHGPYYTLSTQGVILVDTWQMDLILRRNKAKMEESKMEESK